MEHIAVSVIVPIYNAEPWLEECVQSILDQDFPASYGRPATFPMSMACVFSI